MALVGERRPRASTLEIGRRRVWRRTLSRNGYGSRSRTHDRHRGERITPTDFEWVNIADIVIGERARQNPNQDIEKLAASIQDVGLLHPVVITPGMDLVAGHRRILACQSLGY